MRRGKHSTSASSYQDNTETYDKNHRYMYSLLTTTNLLRLVNLTCIFFGLWEEKQQNICREPMHGSWKHENWMNRDLRLSIWNLLAARQLCWLLFLKYTQNIYHKQILKGWNISAGFFMVEAWCLLHGNKIISCQRGFYQPITALPPSGQPLWITVRFTLWLKRYKYIWND